MKIKYQNGTFIEGATLSNTGLVMRIAVKGADDVLELNCINGAWVTEDCEPVTLEIGNAPKAAAKYCDDDFICSQELAAHLIGLLFADSTEESLPEHNLLSALASQPTGLIA